MKPMATSLRDAPPAAPAALAAILATLLGFGIAAGALGPILVLAVIAGLCALAVVQRGALLGLLLLAVLNGIPYLDGAEPVFSEVSISDLAAIILLLVVAVWALVDGFSPRGAGRWLSFFGGALLAWWTLTFLRSIALEGVPAREAVIFSRDFFFFAMFLIVLPRVRLSARQIETMAVVLAFGVAAFALGQVLLATGLADLGGLIHVQHTYKEDGFIRVYATMTDLVTLALLVSVACLIFARGGRARYVALPLAALLTVSVLVQLTRARWIGILLGAVIVIAWLALGSGQASRRLRGRIGLLAGGLAVAALVLGLLAPAILSGGAVGGRIASIVSDLQGGGGTVAIREGVTETMLTLLGHSWIYGLGFISPSAHYFGQLPVGSIRDPDLGVLNAVMTMGAIGALLIYLPPLYTLWRCLRLPPRRDGQGYGWLRYGIAMWVAATLVSSVTLITLYSLSGAVLTAVVLSVALSPALASLSRTGETS